MDKKIIVWVGCLLKDNNDKFLLLRRVQDSSWAGRKWQLPGGKMEWGEKVAETLDREVAEETGGSIENPEFSGAYTTQMNAKGTSFHAVQLVYKGNYSGDKVVMSKDHDDYAWVSLEEAAGMELIDGLSDFIRSQV